MLFAQCLLVPFSHFNVILPLIYKVFAEFFGSKGGIYGALALNVVNFFSTFITMVTIEKCKSYHSFFSDAISFHHTLIEQFQELLKQLLFIIFIVGRVLILFSGGILMCLALIPTAVMSAIDETREEGTESSQGLGIGIITMCAVYVIGERKPFISQPTFNHVYSNVPMLACIYRLCILVGTSCLGSLCRDVPHA